MKLFFKNVIFLIFIFFCSSAESNPLNADIKTIVDRGELIVGVCKIDQPPFYERSKDGALSGYDIDMAKGIAEALGVKLRFETSAENWDELVEQLIQRKIDLAISFLSKTLQRAKTILYSQPYARINQAFLMNRLNLRKVMSKKKKTLDQIFDKDSEEKLIVYEGSSYIKFAKQLFKDVKLVTYKDQADIIRVLSEGKFLGFITDQLEVKSYLDANPDVKLKLLPLVLKNNFDLIAIGVAPNCYQLLQFVNTYIQTHDINININDIKEKDNENKLELKDEGLSFNE